MINQALITLAFKRRWWARWRGHGVPVGYRKSIADAMMIIHNTTSPGRRCPGGYGIWYYGKTITCTPSKTRDSTGVTVKPPVTPELKAWLDDMLEQRRAADADKVVSLRPVDRPLVINEATGETVR